MATNFITNEAGNALRARLIELIEGSDELKFLVGFFYFSGLHELYEGEGHGFRKAETLVDYYQTTERFLREHVIFRG